MPSENNDKIIMYIIEGTRFSTWSLLHSEKRSFSLEKSEIYLLKCRWNKLKNQALKNHASRKFSILW